MAAALRKAPTAFAYLFSNSFLVPKNTAKIQAAGMISKALRDKDFKRPPPFPYKEKKYDMIAAFFDKTTWRFDENSKLIVVDGPVASGKQKLTKQLAEEFDLHYIPHANLDFYYINSYGYDFRNYQDNLPPHLKALNVEDFLANPHDRRAANMQHLLFSIRLEQYIDALGHILSTGQGVIMNRSVYSDFIFMETYIKHGFYPKTYKKYHELTWNCIKPDLMQPHLVIYLDTPVNVVLQNLKKRNNPVEINSPVFKREVLEDFENFYKTQFLPDISKHAELLVYDWSEELDTEVIVEDIERVNLDDYGIHDPKMKDWRLVDEWDYNERRMEFTSQRHLLEIWSNNVPYYDCPEIFIEGGDAMLLETAWDSVPGNKYRPGFNKDLGDEIYLKT